LTNTPTSTRAEAAVDAQAAARPKAAKTIARWNMLVSCRMADDDITRQKGKQVQPVEGVCNSRLPAGDCKADGHFQTIETIQALSGTASPADTASN
jgi:hypothetical protein